MRRAAIVLAAGRGERLGGPKALLLAPRDGGGEGPLALLHVEAFLRASVARVLVVVRESVAELLAPLLPAGAQLVVSHAEDALGPAGSLAAATPYVGDAELVFVTPVDGAPVTVAVAEALVRALGATPGASAARPMFAGRGGHPVALTPRALARYAEPSPPILREHLRALGLLDVPLNEPLVRRDLDTEADVRAAFGGPPRFYRPRSS